MSVVEPFIRWAGGKSWLVPYLKDLISSIQVNNYHEPFLGGAAVFLALDHKGDSYLSDMNKELINTYISIRKCPDQIIEILLTYENTEESYYTIRGLDLKDPIEQAARFIYLNQTSYNGLYRVNSSGNYNVPYGHRKNWHYDVKRILSVSEKLQKSNIKCAFA